MEKIYSIHNLDCANCAAKAEAKIQAVPGVDAASITFATMQLRLTAEDPDALLPQVLATARKVEPDIRFTDLEEPAHSNCSCCCDHDHHEHAHPHHEHAHHHDHEPSELPGILLGAGLFAAGLLLSVFLKPWHIAAFLAAYGILGWRVLLTAGKNLIRGKVFDENFLMSIATIGAFCIGEFPEAAGVMLFFRVGEYFEHRAMERSRKGILEAVDLRPETVQLLSGETIPAGQAKPGDLLLVRPGDRIPLDSTVTDGSSRIDTAPITGEPMPVLVGAGNAVTSGCINLSGVLTLRVEKPLSESMVTRILKAVESAAASKPKMDRFLTRFARVYTPVVVLLAVGTAIIPSLITGNWGYWVYTALSFLVMSCPCALVLSVPLAFFCGIGTGSKKGILFKGGASIEALAEVRAIVMDKTGTLTLGDFSLQEVTGDPDTLRLCAACEQHSSHPIAKSILAYAKDLPLAQPTELEEIPGHGIRATVEGRKLLCGNLALMARFGISVNDRTAVYGSRVYVAADGRHIGTLVIADTVKADAADAVAKLKKQGLYTAMLTGDAPESAEAVRVSTGVDETHARLLPEEKLAALQAIRNTKGAAMFVGDGINDAVVLAGADVGAAMGSGADAAIEAADVVFMTGSVSAIPQALGIARSTRRIAWQNVVFALAIKLVVMVLGLLGWASMWAAVFADSGVAMLCILNAIRLLYKKK